MASVTDKRDSQSNGFIASTWYPKMHSAAQAHTLFFLNFRLMFFAVILSPNTCLREILVSTSFPEIQKVRVVT
jgi:hypothetical protein